MDTMSSSAGIRDLDDTLTALASAQHGVLLTPQLRAAGLSAKALVHLVSRGVLRHPARGAYIVATMERTDPVEGHRQLVAAALLLYPDAVLTGVSAVLAHGLPVWGTRLDRPALRRPVRRSGGAAPFWVRSASGAVCTTDWGPSCPVADALVMLAIDGGIEPAVVSADAALRAGTVDDATLEEAVARVADRPGGSRAVAALNLVDGRRESVGESRCGVALSVAGLSVTPQVEIRDPRGRLVARADWIVDGTRVVVEFDGRLKYAAGDPEVLWAEKRREDRLRALGYVVVRITWSDLERPGAVAAKVRRAVALADSAA